MSRLGRVIDRYTLDDIQGWRAVLRPIFVNFFVLGLVMMTGTRQHPTYMSRDPERQLTILAVSFDDDIALEA